MELSSPLQYVIDQIVSFDDFEITPGRAIHLCNSRMPLQFLAQRDLDTALHFFQRSNCKGIRQLHGWITRLVPKFHIAKSRLHGGMIKLGSKCIVLRGQNRGVNYCWCWSISVRAARFRSSAKNPSRLLRSVP